MKTSTPSITTACFLILALAFTLLSFFIGSLVNVEYMVENLNITLPITIIIGFFASAAVIIAEEPKTEGRVILPSNI